jgi:hypothetical protein
MVGQGPPVNRWPITRAVPFGAAVVASVPGPATQFVDRYRYRWRLAILRRGELRRSVTTERSQPEGRVIRRGRGWPKVPMAGSPVSIAVIEVRRGPNR